MTNHIPARVPVDCRIKLKKLDDDDEDGDQDAVEDEAHTPQPSLTHAEKPKPKKRIGGGKQKQDQEVASTKHPCNSGSRSTTATHAPTSGNEKNSPIEAHLAAHVHLKRLGFANWTALVYKAATIMTADK